MTVACWMRCARFWGDCGPDLLAPLPRQPIFRRRSLDLLDRHLTAEMAGEVDAFSDQRGFERQSGSVEQRHTAELGQIQWRCESS